ncbi:MAG: hypothetical protein IPP10_02775 [Candidatus Competibacteraceae bacterium]|nr:hypothetical protein [Candidatus Competibacteraceae bacterium]MBK7984034.1 hypothetical protein [Candidatus Competibacteraceae bacterium]MBK8897424.1 hypothetical protein [Candidatus Competibacteraceae bacterium]MBK8963575.1 hypothetical protein [Candidatus Competibacteraceae bacterium]MBK9950467.1 hypothetical protein [Candidatus Competibacteraceae bacterium]
MTVERFFSIPDDHPSLAGHFPGNPIVPGVVILDAVLRAFKSEYPSRSAHGMPVVKFLTPLRPGQACAIRFLESNGKLRFDCVLEDGRLLAQGQLRWADTVP